MLYNFIFGEESGSCAELEGFWGLDKKRRRTSSGLAGANGTRWTARVAGAPARAAGAESGEKRIPLASPFGSVGMTRVGPAWVALRLCSRQAWAVFPTSAVEYCPAFRGQSVRATQASADGTIRAIRRGCGFSIPD